MMRGKRQRIRKNAGDEKSIELIKQNIYEENKKCNTQSIDHSERQTQLN